MKRKNNRAGKMLALCLTGILLVRPVTGAADGIAALYTEYIADPVTLKQNQDSPEAVGDGTAIKTAEMSVGSSASDMNIGAEADSDSTAGLNAEADTDSNPNSNSSSNPGSEFNSDFNSDTNTTADADTNANTDSEAASNMNNYTETGGNTDTDSGGGAGGNADLNDDINSGNNGEEISGDSSSDVTYSEPTEGGNASGSDPDGSKEASGSGTGSDGAGESPYIQENEIQNMDTEKTAQTDSGIGEGSDSSDRENAEDPFIKDGEESMTESEDSSNPQQKSLTAENGQVSVSVFSGDEEGFPSGVKAELLTLSDLVSSEEEETYSDLMRSAWTDRLETEYVGEYADAISEQELEVNASEQTDQALPDLDQMIRDQIKEFLIFYVRISDESGQELNCRNLKIDFRIKDSDMYGAVTEHLADGMAGRHMKENGWELDPETGDVTVIPDKGEEALIYSLSGTEPGWFSLLAVNSVWMLEDCSEVLDLSEASVLASSAAVSPSGTRITGSNSGYSLVRQGGTYSSDYNSIRVHSNSVVSFWNNAGDQVSSSLTPYDVPWYRALSKDAKEQYGFRISNVAYNYSRQCYVDLFITVNDFNTWCYDENGVRIDNIYPVIGISDDLTMYFNAIFSSFELKCDFVETGTNTPVTGNYRMRFDDIDCMQRYGISLQNGTLNKYALSSCVLYSETKSYFGHTYECFNASSEENNNDLPEESVVFELTDSSGFYMFFGMELSDTKSVHEAGFVKDTYAVIEKGQKSRFASQITWSGQSYGLVEIPSPVKYVSNDGENPELSSVLPETTSDFYYIIDHYVPEESEKYYYSTYELTDPLPVGVGYEGNWSCCQLESGADVSSWFQVSETDNVLTFTPVEGKLTSSDFYGMHYRFYIHVKLDPDKIQPSYNENTASYLVSNTAVLSVRHKTDASAITQNTNTVTVAASESRVAPAAPYKRIDGDETLTGKSCGNISEEVIFSIYQEIPDEPAAWRTAAVTMEDTLLEVFEYKSCETLFRPTGSQEYAVDAGWTVNVDGQTVTAAKKYEGTLLPGLVRWDLHCSIKAGADLSGYCEIIENRTWAVLTNRASIKYEWPQGTPSAVQQDTNETEVRFPISGSNLQVIKTNKDTEELIPDAEFTVYEWDGEAYSINRGSMTYDSVQGTYIMNNLTRNAVNSGKYKVIETCTPEGYCGAWEQEIEVSDETQEVTNIILNAENPMSRGIITIYKESEKKGELLAGAGYEIKANKDVISPEGMVLIKGGTVVDTLTTDKEGKAVSQKLYPGEYKITETKAPEGYGLDQEPKILQINYIDKDTPVDYVETSFVNSRLYSQITLTKEIDSEHIVWAHGNPVFTFCLQGQDVLGIEHTYYETVEFSPEMVDQTQGIAALSAEFTVLAGSYTAYELSTSRYRLKEIHAVSGGTISEDGSSVYFDVSSGGQAAASFYNEKITDEGGGDTSFVRNIIK